jgi:hypothetical protein
MVHKQDDHSYSLQPPTTVSRQEQRQNMLVALKKVTKKNQPYFKATYFKATEVQRGGNIGAL